MAGGQAPEPAVGVQEFDGGFTVLMVGVDNAGDQSAAYGPRGSRLNDVNILLRVSEDQDSAVVVSLPRDLVIRHPAFGHSVAVDWSASRSLGCLDE